MKKWPIKVVVRMRPTGQWAKQLVVDEVTGHIAVQTEKSAQAGLVNHQRDQWGFRFQKVLLGASQEVLFNLAARDILMSALEGYSGCLLCYGQTGAGKTFTMTGNRGDYKQRGVVPRLLSTLFQQINSRYQHHIKVTVSYVELYNQSLCDLLKPDNVLNIQEDAKSHIIVKGLSQIQVDNEEAALQLLFEGESNRTVAQHKLNRNSSRSHCVFIIGLQIRSRVESSEKVVSAKINLVDLAGSERTKKTGSQGRTLVEAQFINKSLSFLEQVVVALGDEKRDHIPYRQNKLTYLLKDSIGGDSRTVLVANVWPQSAHLQETISTLQFSSRMLRIANEVQVGLALDPALLLKKYQKDIRDLKQELAMHDTLTNRGRISYDPYTPQQQHRQQILAQQFLDGRCDDIHIQSLRQVRQLFLQFRHLYRALNRESNRPAAPDVKTHQHTPTQIGDLHKGSVRVGLQQNNFGFGAGKAQKDAKPSRVSSQLINIPKDQFPEEIPVQGPIKTIIPARLVEVDRQKAYEEFKQSVGAEGNSLIIKNVQELKEQKQLIKIKAEETQKLKDQLQLLNSKLKSKDEAKTAEELAKNIIDEEEFQLIKQKKGVKREYKNALEKVKMLRETILEGDRQLTMAKTDLLQRFQEWFFKKHGISVSDLDNPLLNTANRESMQTTEEQVIPDDVDEDALAYIHAKRKVHQLHRARKQKF